MALTAMGIGTKQAPDNVNLDPQRQFWSWLSTFKNPNELGDSGHHERAYFSGFACTQTTPAGMSIQIGGGDEVDSAAIFISSDRAVLLSTDGTPQKVTIPTAPASGSRIDAVVSYIDTSSPSAGDETPGTPEYVKTIVVSGTASGSPTAPTDAQIVSALPAGAGGVYYRWCDVRVAQGTTTITNSNITDKKPMSPNVYSATIWNGHGGRGLTNNDKIELESVTLPAGDWLILTSCLIQASDNAAGLIARVDAGTAPETAVCYGSAYLPSGSYGMLYAIGLYTSDGVTPIALKYQKTGNGTINVSQRRNAAIRVTHLTSLSW